MKPLLATALSMTLGVAPLWPATRQAVTPLSATTTAMVAGRQRAVLAPAETLSFTITPIDPGGAESAATADVNNDGRLDIISAGAWFEAPRWTKHVFREVPVSSGYVDSFSDLPLDVDADGFVDVIQIGYFARRIIWMRNPGSGGGVWSEHLIDAVGPTEFAFLVDLDNDGRARELLPQFTGAANAPLCWYESRGGEWVKHVVGDRSYGHGIGVGDVDGNGRNDILTPVGWLEGAADVRAPGSWVFHAQPWNTRPPDNNATPAPPGPPRPVRPLEFGYMHTIDVNGDGRRDIVATDGHNYGIYWFEQLAGGTWERHLIDDRFSESHASVLTDISGDGQADLITGKRFQARNQNDPGVAEPLGVYWYEFKRGPTLSVQWTRHTISEGGTMGTGLQLRVVDVTGDGKLDIIAPGKSGLFIAEQT